ncbi:CoA-binding protein [Lignipirellula cremea]|uniref:CoA-binding domain-containing protein n=1 Tax=Lignipirellula cremea TaxID=2528010 RepID=A0A518E3V3_9BACT|nr:CoA-binding protein [Lignipirellula cremea]QDU98758.1 hypothetical protein Pla8534_66310 [Lignipirellula cremea]
MNVNQQIEAFLAGEPHAVVGASRDRSKYGNKVFRAYQQHQRPVYPVNPHADSVEGETAYADLASLPETVHGVSVITPPAVTWKILEQAAALGVKHVWLQPGAEAAGMTQRAEELGLNLISGGPCLLVVIGYHE